MMPDSVKSAAYAVFLIRYINEELDQLKLFDKPLTEQQAFELVKRYGYHPVRKQLANLNNYKGAVKKYRSVYLTAMKWFEADEKKAKQDETEKLAKNTALIGSFSKAAESMPDFAKSLQDLERRCAQFIETHPVGSSFVNTNGNEFLVESNEFLVNKKSKNHITLKQFLNNYKR